MGGTVLNMPVCPADSFGAVGLYNNAVYPHDNVEEEVRTSYKGQAFAFDPGFF
mgnify:CR=1 FL=1